MKIQYLKIGFLVLILIAGCKKDDNGNSGTPGNLGEVGNTWKVKIDGAHELSAEIVEKTDEIFTLQVSWAKFNVGILKFGFTGNEVVDYVYSHGDESQAFTMVEFDAKVGDIYSLNIKGVSHIRQVTEKSKYYIPALDKDLETIGVYEEIPPEVQSEYFGLTITSIVWYWHPDYGLVCVDFYTSDGAYHKVEFIQIL